MCSWHSKIINKEIQTKIIKESLTILCSMFPPVRYKMSILISINGWWIYLQAASQWTFSEQIIFWTHHRMATLPSINALSDDESQNCVAAPGPKPKFRGGRTSLRRPGRGRIIRAAGGGCGPNNSMKNLSNLIRGKCGCKADCFSQFRHQLVLDEWLKQRKLMAKMEKLEKDDHVRVSFFSHSSFVEINWIPDFAKNKVVPAQVFKLLQAQAEESCRGSRHIRFLGKPVCNKGFMKLVGIGKYRFNTLSLAARNGEQFCPYDGRYMMKEKKAPSEKWLAVHNFLTGLYVEIAEPIPDGLNSNKRPRSGSTKRDDPKIDRSKIKHLPHGSIGDYFSQCLAANPGLHISRKLFSSDPVLDFVCIFLLLFLFEGKVYSNH